MTGGVSNGAEPITCGEVLVHDWDKSDLPAPAPCWLKAAGSSAGRLAMPQPASAYPSTRPRMTLQSKIVKRRVRRNHDHATLLRVVFGKG